MTEVKTFIPQVRHILDNHTSPVPAILEIPSKDSPYDPNKDSILRYILITAACVQSDLMLRTVRTPCADSWSTPEDRFGFLVEFYPILI